MSKKLYNKNNKGNRKTKPVKKHTNKREIISKEEYAISTLGATSFTIHSLMLFLFLS